MTKTQLTLPLAVTPQSGREDFITAPCNEEAARFVDAYPHWPAPQAALFGVAGSGKSHLAAVWARGAGSRVLAASELDERVLSDAGPLAVEDVDRAGPHRRDDVLFALFNLGHALLLTGRTHPASWAVTLDDLASRFRATLAFALYEPDDALLASLARKLFADRQLRVPEPVIGRMLVTVERSPGALRDFVARADDKALTEKRPITLALIRELLPGAAPEE